MKINKKGFTLIELLVVIAIIGLLSTLAVVSLNSARVKARDARRMSDLKQISTAMELYYSDNEAYPTTVGTCANGTIAASDGGALCSGFQITNGTDVYLAAIPADPSSGSNYIYNAETSGYCIEATLEAGDPFICNNGSCYSLAGGCP